MQTLTSTASEKVVEHPPGLVLTRRGGGRAASFFLKSVLFLGERPYSRRKTLDSHPAWGGKILIITNTTRYIPLC